MPPTPDFTIATSDAGTRTTIRVVGELDSDTAPMLREHHERAAAARPAGELLLDLREVTFIDSSGLRAIVLMQRSAGRRGASLMVLQPPQAVIELMELAGLADRLTVVADPAAGHDDLSFHERCELNLARASSAPARARSQIRRVVGERLDGRGLDAATLLTSELVTNAVIHPEEQAEDVIGLRITSYDDRVRIEVSDNGAGFDPGRAHPPRDTGGRGLLLVQAIASRWGTRRRDPGRRFTVWFELDDAQSSAPAVGIA